MSSVKMKKAQHSRKHKLLTEKPFCGYLHRHCTQPRLDGYTYCIRHILEDKNAPFRQCSYVQQQNRKRCTNAAPKNDKRDSLCPWHVKQAQLTRIPAPKKAEGETLAGLLSQLERYCQDASHNTLYDADEDTSVRYKSLSTSGEASDLPSLGATIDGHKALLDQAWLCHSDESESDIDECDYEDPLRYAGVYTYEEVARIHRDKLVQLQSLYIDQFKYLQYRLREKRRDYLHAVKNEKKTLGSICSTPRPSKKEETAYQKLKSMYRYHHRYGAEGVLHYKSLQKRQSKLTNSKHSKWQSCIWSTDGKKCSKKAVVLSKFCFEHILFDSQQVLFKRCIECPRPIVPFADNNACLLHSRCGVTSEKQLEIENSPVTGPSGTSTLVSDIIIPDHEHFQSMDDIASLGLDAVVPGSLFGLNQFGEPGESTDSALSDDHGDLMQIQRMGLNTSDILCDSRKSSGSESVK